jgi:tetratricopeptide (TPR) repeat protein
MLAAVSILCLLFAQAEPAGYAKATRAFAAHDFRSADAAVREVLKENPHYVPALLLEARLSMVQGRMDEAIDALKRAISEDPARGESKFLLGFAYYLKNNFEQADGALANADQKDGRVLLYRAMSAEGLNRADAARDFYTRAIQAEPRGTDARIAYARLLRKQGDTAQASKLVDEAFAIAPEARDILYEKGLSLLDGGRYPEAVDFGQRALRAPGSVPTEREIRFLLIRAWQKAGESEKADKERAIFEKLPMPLVR